MSADDALSEILARHLDGKPDQRACRSSGPEPAIISDICDAALLFLNSVASLVGLAETALLSRRARLGPQARPTSGVETGPTRIPIQRH